jgi:hypothetical protein
MQMKKLALIGFSALALTAYGTVFASSHEKEAAEEKKAAGDSAEVAKEYADEKQAEAETAVRSGAADAEEKVGEAADAKAVSSELHEKAAE